MTSPFDKWSTTRRKFFSSSASGLGFAASLSLLRAGESSADQNRESIVRPQHAARAKKCIFIYLAGGTSHIDLFDPKPLLKQRSGQPLPESFYNKQRFSNIKRDTSLLMDSPFGYQRYGDCGVEMSSLLPHIGKQADKICLVRSLHTDEFDHAPAEIFFSTGVNTPGRPSAGAWVLYGLGSETSNLPGYVVLMAGRSPVARATNWGNAFLPASCGGVLFRTHGEPVLNLSTPDGISQESQELQLKSINQLNQLRYDAIQDPSIQSRIHAYELAFRMQATAPGLIDLTAETSNIHKLYGTDRPGEAGSFSTNCLLARRLVERGTRFVSLFHRRWDHHSKLAEKLPKNCHIVDQPIGALLSDLSQRGMLDDTLVIFGSEFGRTPVTENSKIGRSAGRDHHRYGFSVWMAGGGTRGGHTVGATDEVGWNAVENPVHVNDFHATMLHLMGLDHSKLTYNFRGLDVKLSNLGGRVVPEVIQ